MAFSIRKMLSNMYFKKPDEDTKELYETHKAQTVSNNSVMINFEARESASAIHSASVTLPDSVKKFVEKKGSLSDTDLLTISVGNKEKKRKPRKLTIDVNKATDQELTDDSLNVENTPRKLLLDGNLTEDFSERLKVFDFNKSFDLFDELSDEPSTPNEDVNLDSFSECSESDIPNDSPIKMCRKVNGMHSSLEDNLAVSSSSPESFADIESEKNLDERVKLILNYQLKLEEIACLMKKLLNDYQFHVEISKTFKNKTFYNSRKSVDDINEAISPSPAESWNMISVKEEDNMKFNLKKQLWSMKSFIEQFVLENLEIYNSTKKCKPCKRSVSDLGKKQVRNISKKKKVKYFDYPDIRDAMINLFLENDGLESTNQCQCQCHEEIEDSGSTVSSEQSLSITSSIGNFSLDSSELTTFSESLDQFISYSSFDDSSLYNTLFQIPAIDRIKFYVQVHSIELKSKQTEIESKNITFHCPPCKYLEPEEDGLLLHILSQSHCEKIHFLYKTAYIKKCVSTGKEIQPSTVLNPMKMYRDENKIVCFGDAIYACTLCFENNIIGESILMAHCSESVHIDRRNKLIDIF